MSVARPPLDRVLGSLARTLPRGSVFLWEAEPDLLRLDVLAIPPGRRGGGTDFLASVLAEADAAGVPTALLADPTDEPGDPCTYESARWYPRFGFEMIGLNDDEHLEMMRTPRDPRHGAESVRADHEDARSRNDMTLETFSSRIGEFFGRRRGGGPGFD